MDMKYFGTFRYAAVAGLVSLSLMAGCKSKDQAALDQARAQAASTGTAQQIQYIDANGDTVTTTVAPPVSGQPQQVSTAITPAPAGPKPKRTDPVVTPYGVPAPGNGLVGSGAGPAPVQQNYDPGAPAGQPMATNGGPGAPVQAVDVRVPAGTSLAVRINQHISVKTSRVGDRFSGEMAEPVEVDGRVVIPRGTPHRRSTEGSVTFTLISTTGSVPA